MRKLNFTYQHLSVFFAGLFIIAVVLFFQALSGYNDMLAIAKRQSSLIEQESAIIIDQAKAIREAKDLLNQYQALLGPTTKIY